MRCAFAFLIAFVLVGCEATPLVPDASARAKFGQMQVITTSTPALSELRVYAGSTGQGAGRGATEGGTIGATTVLLASTSEAGGTMVVAGTPVGAIVVVTSLIVGSAFGAYAALPADIATQLDAATTQALAATTPNERLVVALRRHAAELPEARAHGLDRALDAGDTRLELQVTAAGFYGGHGREAVTRFYLSVRSRVLAPDGAVLYQRDFLHLSAPRPWEQWLEDDAAALTAAFEPAFDELAAHALEELFIVTRFPFASGFWAFPGTARYGTCWLRPLDPPYRFHLPPLSLKPDPDFDNARDMVDFTPVASLTPTLRWESFPRPSDMLEENEELIAHISDVTYDLKLWEVVQGQPGRLVYDRSGLAAPEHTLDQPLLPDHDYYWSFRARYRFDGEPAATRWAFSLLPAPPGAMDRTGSYCERDSIPPTNYYRFTTRQPH